jgi:hypothetical protein
MKKLVFYLITFLVLSMISCNKSENIDKVTAPKFSTDRSSSITIEESRFAFAKSLNAALLSDIAFRDYLKKNLHLVDSMNSEFIYLQYKDSLIHSNKSFSEILKENTSAADLNILGLDFFDNITQVDPLLALSMPDETGCDISAWQASSALPDVAAVLTDPNGGYFKFSGSQLNGELINLDPTSPIIAVWKAEAYYLINSNGMTIDGIDIKDILPSKLGVTDRGECNLLMELARTALLEYEESGTYWYLVSHNQLIDLYNACLVSEGNSSGATPMNPGECERDFEVADEHLVRFRINGWGAFKTIDNQFWENKYVFHADVLAAREYSNGSAIPHTAKCVTKTYRKKDLLEGCGTVFGGTCRGQWQTLDYRIWTDWNLENFGSPYYIDWAEVDHGAITTTLSFPLTSKFSFTIPTIGTVERTASVVIGYSRVGDKIVALGNAPVFYCDKILRTNSTSSIEFQCD